MAWPGRTANKPSSRRRARWADVLPGKGVQLAIGAVIAVIGITYFAMQSIDLTPRGVPTISDAAFQTKYCQRAVDQVPRLVVAQPSLDRVDVDGTIWSMLSTDQRRAFVSAMGCVNAGHPMGAGDHLTVAIAPSGTLAAEANGATIRLIDQAQ